MKIAGMQLQIKNPYAGIIQIRFRANSSWVSSQPAIYDKHPISLAKL